MIWFKTRPVWSDEAVAASCRWSHTAKECVLIEIEVHARAFKASRVVPFVLITEMDVHNWQMRQFAKMGNGWWGKPGAAVGAWVKPVAFPQGGRQIR